MAGSAGAWPASNSQCVGIRNVGDQSKSPDGVTTQLLDEVQHALKIFKERPDVDDGVVESLNSIVSRLQTKRASLSKKASRDKTGETLRAMDVVSTEKAKANGVLDVVKAALTADKKGSLISTSVARQFWRFASCGCSSGFAAHVLVYIC